MKAAIIDLETTGLLKHPRANPALQPRCIEFGAIVIDEHGKQLETMSLLINPKQRLEAIITKITGITNDALKDQPVFADVADDISTLIGGCDVVIAHNLPFDSGVLDLEYDRIHRPIIWPATMMCTVQENVPVYGYRIKLKDLYRDVTGQAYQQTHRALDDCRLLAEIVVHEGYLEELS